MNVFLRLIIGVCAAAAVSACSRSSSEPEYFVELLSATVVPLQIATDDTGPSYVLVGADGSVRGPKRDFIGDVHQGLALYRKELPDSAGGIRMLYGYVNKKNEVVIKAQYASATDFSDGLAWVAKPDSGLIAINRDGGVQFRLPDACAACIFINGYACAADTAGNVSLVDNKGHEIELPDSIRAATVVDDRYLVATVAGADSLRIYRLENGAFKRVEAIEKREVVAVSITMGLAAVRDGDGYRIVGFDGTPVTNRQYNEVAFAGNAVLVKNRKGKVGILNADGKQLVAPQFKDVHAHGIGNKYFIALATNNLLRVIDRNGKMAVPCEGNLIKPLTETLFAVNDQGKWCILDASLGIMSCEPRFNNVESSGRVLLASDGAKYGVIDREGRLLGDTIYERKYDIRKTVAFSRNVPPE